MNIQSIVNEILNHGYSQKDIAEYVGCSQPTVSDISNGIQKTTNLDIGLKILELHKSVSEKAA
jgi:predicted XRE-type DNA-binding protein